MKTIYTFTTVVFLYLAGSELAFANINDESATAPITTLHSSTIDLNNAILLVDEDKQTASGFELALLSFTIEDNDNPASVGDRVSVSYTVRNLSGVEAEDVPVDFYFSDDNVYSEDDIFLEREDITVNEFETESDNEQLNGLPNVSPGCYYLIIVLNGGTTPVGSDEDNARYAELAVDVSATTCGNSMGYTNYNPENGNNNEQIVCVTNDMPCSNIEVREGTISTDVEACNQIVTVGTVIVEENASVSFQTGNSILLQAGFQVQAGSTFRAFIAAPCTNNLEDNKTSQIIPTVSSRSVFADFVVHPNPITSSLQIITSLEEATPVQLTLLNLNGQRVAHWMYRNLEAGQQQLELTRPICGAGIYVLRLQTNYGIVTRQVVLL